MSWTLRAGWLGGGLIGRELRIASRRRGTYLLRIGYLLTLATLIASGWLAIGSQRSVAGLAQSQELGKQFVQFVGAAQYALLMILSAVLFGRSLLAEARGGTLETLLSTPMEGWQVLVGKLVGQTAVLGTLLACSMPTMALMRVFGGVPWSFLLGVACVSAGACVLVGAATLAAAVLDPRPTVATLLGLSVGALSAAGALAWRPNLSLATQGTICMLGPGTGLGALNSQLYGQPGGTVVWVWLASTGASLMWAALLIAIAGCRVHRLCQRCTGQDESRLGRVAWGRTSSLTLSGGFFGEMVGPAIFKRELRPVLPDARLLLVAIPLGIGAVVGLSFVFRQMAGAGAPSGGALVAGALAAMVIGLAAAAGATFAEDRRSRVDVLLLGLPIEDRTLVLAKAARSAYAMRFGLLLALGAVLIALPMDVAFWQISLLWSAWLSGGVLAIGVGLYVGLRRPSMSAGPILALVTLFGLWVVLPVLLAAAISPVAGVFFSPAAATLEILYPAGPGGESAVALVIAVAVGAVLQIAAGAALVWKTQLELRRRVLA